jgi:hypothetical protein
LLIRAITATSGHYQPWKDKYGYTFVQDGNRRNLRISFTWTLVTFNDARDMSNFRVESNWDYMTLAKAKASGLAAAKLLGLSVTCTHEAKPWSSEAIAQDRKCGAWHNGTRVAGKDSKRRV